MTGRRHAILVALVAGVAAPPAAHAQVPGADGLLAYTSNGLAIRTLDPATGADVPLTAGPGDSNPRWSPDGALIAFQRQVGAAPEALWVMNADGTDQVPLAPSFTWAGPAAWAPDGTYLLVAGRRAGSDGLFRVLPDGSGATLLVRGRISGPALSPDGRRVAYSRVPAGFDDDARTELWVAAADGSGRRRITSGGYDIAPDWSPDGSLLAYRARRAGFTCPAYPGSVVEQVRLIRPDGGGRRNVTDGCEAGVPTFAPAGGRVAYSQLSPAGGLRLDVYVAPTAPGAATCLTCARVLGDAFATLAWQPLPRGPRGRVRAGSPAGETLVGGAGRDVVAGRAGADRLRGLGGNDVVLGGDGRDVLEGGPGRDLLSAGPGNDVIRARDGRRDVIHGGPGRDVAVVDRLDVVLGVERVLRR